MSEEEEIELGSDDHNFCCALPDLADDAAKRAAAADRAGQVADKRELTWPPSARAT